MSNRNKRTHKPRKQYDAKKAKAADAKATPMVKQFYNWLFGGGVSAKSEHPVNLLPFSPISFHKTKQGAKRRAHRQRGKQRATA